MATYVLPQVLVFQDFTIAPSAAANPLSAHIAGGHAYLTRTTDADEKENGFLGYYDNTTTNAYSWPTRPAGALVDESYTKVYIENALLEYYDDPMNSENDIKTVATHRNRIKGTGLNFATNGTYTRSAEFYDRDVEVGDDIRVRALPDGGGDPIVLWTSIKSLIANEIAAVVGAATTDTANNAGTTVADVDITKEAGANNCITVSNHGPSSDYNGILDGHTTETYTIVVIEGSAGGVLESGKLRVLSASGTDDVAEVQPSAAGSPTSIGTRGLVLQFSYDDGAACSTSADDEGVNHDDLIKGQQWKVVVAQGWEQAAASTTTGNLATYTTKTSTTYVVSVTRGGLYSDTVNPPQISVTTTNGIDQSGPHNVTGQNVDVTIGSFGAVVKFNNNNSGGGPGLVKGDRYNVPVTGKREGAIQTIELSDNIAATVDPDASGGEDVGIVLYIRKPLLEVPQNRAGFAPVTNWQQSATQITLSQNINAYDDSYTDNGVLKSLNVFSCAGCYYGKTYVTYRAWQPTKANSIFSISDVGDIDDISGSLTPDNPLKWGVYKALANSNNTPVLYTAVTDPNDADDWDEVLDLTQARDDVHAMVPLTRNATVLGLYQGHVGAMSTESAGLWRTAWFNLQGIPEIPLVSTGSTVPGHTQATTSDGEECLAVFEDDPLSTGDQYTQVRNEESNGKFITNGVRPGDIVRAVYDGDGFGNYTYEEFVVDAVQSEQQLLVKTGPTQPIVTPSRIEIWRTLNLTEEAEEIAKDAGSYYDRRIMAIWPDEIESSGTIQEGFHLCAALAGLTSGVLPQQGLTRLGISTFSDVQRTTRFSKSQLDKMAISGTWIVMQAPDGNIFTRQAVTTGNYSDINQREEMLTRNVDSISYRFKDYFEPFIGVTNVTPSMEAVIQAGISTLITVLQTERFTVNLGGQLIDAELQTFEVSPIFKDRYVAKLLLTVPYALNNLELHLIV